MLVKRAQENTTKPDMYAYFQGCIVQVKGHLINRGSWNFGCPSESLKPREYSFDHCLCNSYQIIFQQFCTESGSNTVVLWLKFQNYFTTEINVINKINFAIFEDKMSYEGLSYITTPRIKFHYKMLVYTSHHTRWHHQMETFSALPAICGGNSPVSSEFPA